MTSRRGVISLIFGLALMLGPVVLAHEGHDHKVMGTVSMIHENHLEVKDKDGKTVTVTLNEKTKILRGKQKATKAAIKEGERIVVTYVSQEKAFVAKEVRLGGKATTETK